MVNDVKKYYNDDSLNAALNEIMNSIINVHRERPEDDNDGFTLSILIAAPSDSVNRVTEIIEAQCNNCNDFQFDIESFKDELSLLEYICNTINPNRIEEAQKNKGVLKWLISTKKSELERNTIIVVPSFGYKKTTNGYYSTPVSLKNNICGLFEEEDILLFYIVDEAGDQKERQDIDEVEKACREVITERDKFDFEYDENSIPYLKSDKKSTASLFIMRDQKNKSKRIEENDSDMKKNADRSEHEIEWCYE